MAQAGDRPVGDHLPVEVLERRSLDVGPPRERLSCDRGEPQLHAAHGRDVPEGEDRDRREVHQQGSPEAASLEGEVLREPDDDGREERPDIPVAAVEDEQGSPVDDRAAERERELPGDRRGQQAEPGCRQHHDLPAQAVARLRPKRAGRCPHPDDRFGSQAAASSQARVTDHDPAREVHMLNVRRKKRRFRLSYCAFRPGR